MNITNKVIAITGGAQGIGLSTAQSIVEKGGKVALLDLDQGAVDGAVKMLSRPGAEVRGYLCNVTDEEAVVETFRQLVGDLGGLHGLVNNAGVLRDATLLKVKDGQVVGKMSVEDYQLVVDVHMKGAFLCAREAATYMIENQVEDGCIIGMSSAAFRGNFGQTNYSAAKAGIVAMSRVWSKELARYNIRTTAIAPGTIETDMLKSMPKEALEKLKSYVPLGRLGQAHHIAQTVISILENDYLSGGVIDVSGGLYM